MAPKIASLEYVDNAFVGNPSTKSSSGHLAIVLLAMVTGFTCTRSQVFFL